MSLISLSYANIIYTNKFLDAEVAQKCILLQKGTDGEPAHARSAAAGQFFLLSKVHGPIFHFSSGTFIFLPLDPWMKLSRPNLSSSSTSNASWFICPRASFPHFTWVEQLLLLLTIPFCTLPFTQESNLLNQHAQSCGHKGVKYHDVQLEKNPQLRLRTDQ